MNSENCFHFAHSQHLNGVSMLTAQMSSFAYDKHAHEEYSLGVTLQGRQDFFCQRAYHRSPKGGVLLFNSDDVHDGCSGGEQNLQYIMLYIHPDSFATQFKALGVRNPQDLRINDCLIDDPQLRQQILNLADLIRDAQSSCIEQESLLFHLAYTLVLRAGSLNEAPYKNRRDTLLLRARDFIQSNMDKALSVADIASAANMSKYHFIRLFRSQFGITPHQYVLSCRLNGARKSLESGLPTSAVAQQYGFADSSHFNRRFKRVYGMTPGQYQSQLT